MTLSASRWQVIAESNFAWEREALEWLAWLIGQQTIALGSPDARDQCSRAFAALDEIGAALAALDQEEEHA